MKHDQNTLNWLRLMRSENIGPITFNKLIEFYGDAGRALNALPEMAKRGGRKKPLVAYPEKKAIDEIKALEKLGGRLLIKTDTEYPAHLAACEDAPPVLAVLGNIDLLSKQGVGVVGGRNASINGQKIAAKFAAHISEAGYPVISGLARGIDAAAHKASLQHGTVAVVAGGIDVIYPEQNTDLYNEIIEYGAVIAESPIGTQPQKHFFPKRNRIIAGLSYGVTVIEAKRKSGSLITANMALDYGRDVYAVPGSPLDPRSSGANDLIKTQAAQLVTNPEDVINDIQSSLKSTFKDTDEPNHLSGLPKPMADAIKDTLEDNRAKCSTEIMNCLSATPIHIDEIIRETDCTPAIVQAILLEFELGGVIQRHPGGLINLILE